MGNCPNTQNRYSSKTPKTKTTILVTSKTWSKNACGLFDYESDEFIKKNMKIEADGIISRKNNSVAFVSNNSSKQSRDSQEVEGLIKIIEKDKYFYVENIIKPINIASPRPAKKITNITSDEFYDQEENDPWIVVKTSQEQGEEGWKLKEGDVIRFGRIMFRIREFRLAQDSSAANKNKNSSQDKENIDPNVSMRPKSHENDFPMSSNKKKEFCKICLEDRTENMTPLIAPCRCSGTMRFIHLSCLRKCLNNKTNIKRNGENTTYYWKDLDCDLCKSTFPQKVTVENTEIDLVELTKPPFAYIILELLNKEYKSKGCFVLSMNNKASIKLGRCNSSDVKISDISVSRCHALIKLLPDGYYLEDNASKFGTLVKLRGPLHLEERKLYSLQCGRSLLSICLQTKQKPLSIIQLNKKMDDTKSDRELVTEIGDSYNNNWEHFSEVSGVRIMPQIN